jgi:multidrug efflux pump subunit AcrA (membrane-fusion protein)
MKKKTVLKVSAVPVILAVGVLAMSALGSTERQSNRREAAPEPRAVETQRLAFGDLTLQVEGDGVVESERTLNMVSEAGGRVLFAMNDLKDGTFVREGEVVLRIDSRDVENDLYALRSDFLNAVASVLPELQIDDARIYRRWFDYFNSLDINKPVPELPEVTNPQEKIKISTRNIIGQYYAVRNQAILLSKHTIRAPFDGFVSSNGIIEGSFVSTGQQLFTLTDPKNLVVTVPLLVEESQTIDFSTVPRVTVYADEGSDDTRTGRITRKQASVDRNSQTLNVYVTFANNDLNPNFLPGSYVHVSIDGRTLRDVAPLPRHMLDPEAYVYTYEDGSLGRQQFEVVAYQGDRVIVKNTVSHETVIVTTILQRPLIGMSIRSMNMPELNPAETGELAEQDGEAEAVAAGG